MRVVTEPTYIVQRVSDGDPAVVRRPRFVSLSLSALVCHKMVENWTGRRQVLVFLNLFIFKKYLVLNSLPAVGRFRECAAFTGH